MSLFKSLNVKVLNAVEIKAPEITTLQNRVNLSIKAGVAAANADSTIASGALWVDSSDEYKLKKKA